MDIIQADSSVIDENEDVAIHLFYYVLDYDFRKGLFTDESSLYDMCPIGLKNYDYEKIADEYEEKKNNSFSYRESIKFYDFLLQKRWEKIIEKKLQNHYGLIFNPKVNLLVDIIGLMKTKFPLRDWSQDNIFIIKKLDLEYENQEKEVIKEKSNIIKLPYNKKLTEEDILAGTNPFLLKNLLNISFEEATDLANSNYDLKTKNKIFKPYRPETKDK